MLFTAALRTLTTCTCVRGVVREGYDEWSDIFVQTVGQQIEKDGTDSDADKDPDKDPDKTPVKKTPVKALETTYTKKTPGKTLQTAYGKKTSGRGRRQRGTPKPIVDVNPVLPKTAAKTKTDAEIIKDVCSCLLEVKEQLDDLGTQVKAIQDTDRDIARVDKQRAEAEVDKNLALAKANSKTNVVTSLRSQLSRKTALHDKEKEKAKTLYVNARRTQNNYRRTATKHCADFREAVEKAANDILGACATLVKELDSQLDDLTKDNNDYLSSQKRKAPEDLSQPPAAQKASP